MCQHLDSSCREPETSYCSKFLKRPPVKRGPFRKGDFKGGLPYGHFGDRYFEQLPFHFSI